MESSTSTPTSAPDAPATPRDEGNHAVKSTNNLLDEAPGSEEIWVDEDLVANDLSFGRVFEGFQELSTMPIANDEQKRQLVGLSSKLILSACTELAVEPELVNIDWQELYSLASRPTFLDVGPSDRAFFHGRGGRPGVFALKQKLGGAPSTGEQKKAYEARAEEEEEEEEETPVRANTGKQRAVPPGSDSEEATAAKTNKRRPKRAKTATKKVQKAREAREAREERVAALGDEVRQLRAAWKAKHPDRLRGPAGRSPPLEQLVTVAQADADIERMRYEAAHYLASDPVAVAAAAAAVDDGGGGVDDDDEALLDSLFAHRTVDIPLPTLKAYQMALGDLVYAADSLYRQVYPTDADAAAAAAEQRYRQLKWDAKGPSGARAKALRVAAFRAKYLAALRFRAARDQPRGLAGPRRRAGRGRGGGGGGGGRHHGGLCAGRSGQFGPLLGQDPDRSSLRGPREPRGQEEIAAQRSAREGHVRCGRASRARRVARGVQLGPVAVRDYSHVLALPEGVRRRAVRWGDGVKARGFLIVLGSVACNMYYGLRLIRPVTNPYRGILEPTPKAFP